MNGEEVGVTRKKTVDMKCQVTLVAIFSICYLNTLSASPLNDEVIDLSQYGSRMYGFPSEVAGQLVANADLTKSNPEELGPYVEGDILIPRPASKNGIIGESFRWPKGVIPFEISPTFDAKYRNIILQGMEEYHKHTCIRFVKRTAAHKDYIYFTNTNTGCWSSVGRIGGRQELNLQSPGCTTMIGTSIHEMMHAVGFMHEQNRHERDGWIVVNSQNIRSGYESNFDKMSSSKIDAMGIAYDYGSVMHYNLQAFSKNEKPTMVPTKKTNAEIGQRRAFSKLDIEKINKMYKCRGTTSELGQQGGGGGGGNNEGGGSGSSGSIGSIVGGIFGLVGPDDTKDAEEVMIQDKPSPH